jgi:hypothetical protein
MTPAGEASCSTSAWRRCSCAGPRRRSGGRRYSSSQRRTRAAAASIVHRDLPSYLVPATFLLYSVDGYKVFALQSDAKPHADHCLCAFLFMLLILICCTEGRAGSHLHHILAKPSISSSSYLLRIPSVLSTNKCTLKWLTARCAKLIRNMEVTFLYRSK